MHGGEMFIGKKVRSTRIESEGKMQFMEEHRSRGKNRTGKILKKL